MLGLTRLRFFNHIMAVEAFNHIMAVFATVWLKAQYLCTPERQSLCESHRQRRWLTRFELKDKYDLPIRYIFS